MGRMLRRGGTVPTLSEPYPMRLPEAVEHFGVPAAHRRSVVLIHVLSRHRYCGGDIERAQRVKGQRVVLAGDSRSSDSPLVDCVWTARSEGGGSFTSIATGHCEMVVTWHPGKRPTMTLRGPETRPTRATYDPDQTWLGIQFNIGVVFPHIGPDRLVDQAITLPNAGDRSFWLHGAAWTMPDLENADQFVQRLVEDGALVLDPVVTAARHGQETGVAARSQQRRFVRVTGLSQSTIRQIDRARLAADLLLQGVPILDTVLRAGYSDQPHLTRSLRQWMGQTPAEMARNLPRK